MAARSIWNGTITFGMVNVPVKLYSATESKSVHFHEVHAPRRQPDRASADLLQGGQGGALRGGRQGLRGQPGQVRRPRARRGQGRGGRPRQGRHIEEFVDAADIDPVFFEKTYFVGSRDDEDAYRLLHEALRSSGRAGIGRFTFHDREYLVAVRALDDVLALHTLRFADEVVGRRRPRLERPRRKPSKQEVQMARRLIESLHATSTPTDYEDTYREAVLDLIKRKAKGKEIDLAAAGGARARRRPGRRARGQRRAGR